MVGWLVSRSLRSKLLHSLQRIAWHLVRLVNIRCICFLFLSNIFLFSVFFNPQLCVLDIPVSHCVALVFSYLHWMFSVFLSVSVFYGLEEQRGTLQYYSYVYNNCSYGICHTMLPFLVLPVTGTYPEVTYLWPTTFFLREVETQSFCFFAPEMWFWKHRGHTEIVRKTYFSDTENAC